MNHCFEANKAKAEKNYYILFNKTCKNSQKKQKIVDETDSKKKYVAGQTSVQYL